MKIHLTEQEKTELKFIFKTAKEILISLSIAFTIIYLIVQLWKI